MLTRQQSKRQKTTRSLKRVAFIDDPLPDLYCSDEQEDEQLLDEQLSPVELALIQEKENQFRLYVIDFMKSKWKKFFKIQNKALTVKNIRELPIQKLQALFINMINGIDFSGSRS